MRILQRLALKSVDDIGAGKLREMHTLPTKRWLWALGLERRGRFVNSKRELSIDVVLEQLIGTIYEKSISPVDDTMAEDLIVSCRTQWSEQLSCRWMSDESWQP